LNTYRCDNIKFKPDFSEMRQSEAELSSSSSFITPEDST